MTEDGGSVGSCVGGKVKIGVGSIVPLQDLTSSINPSLNLLLLVINIISSPIISLSPIVEVSVSILTVAVIKAHVKPFGLLLDEQAVQYINTS